ncbi:hypothetical protein ACZ90_22530 [Streptomyces albus subsp. albus]|nr:hypothetical protein ACZ90_22530 [Streptomyces albus subsp. albus]
MPQGPVTFLVRSQEGPQQGTVRALLPRYAAAEADRVGCGAAADHSARLTPAGPMSARWAAPLADPPGKIPAKGRTKGS